MCVACLRSLTHWTRSSASAKDQSNGESACQTATNVSLTRHLTSDDFSGLPAMGPIPKNPPLACETHGFVPTHSIAWWCVGGENQVSSACPFSLFATQGYQFVGFLAEHKSGSYKSNSIKMVKTQTASKVSGQKCARSFSRSAINSSFHALCSCQSIELF
jgi:hypothetical protein